MPGSSQALAGQPRCPPEALVLTAVDGRVGGALRPRMGQFGLCRGFPLPSEQGDGGLSNESGGLGARQPPPWAAASLLTVHVYPGRCPRPCPPGTRVCRGCGQQLTNYPRPHSAGERRGSEGEASLLRSPARAGGEETSPGPGAGGREADRLQVGPTAPASAVPTLRNPLPLSGSRACDLLPTRSGGVSLP